MQPQTTSKTLTRFGALLMAGTLLFAACGEDSEPVTAGGAPTSEDASGVSDQELPPDPDADATGGDEPDSLPPDQLTEPGDSEPPVVSGAYQPTEPRIDLLDPRPAVIDQVVTSDDPAVLLVQYQNASEPCSGANATVEETADTVTVSLQTGLHPNAAAMSCIAQVLGYELAVALSEPLGDRQIVMAEVPDGPVIDGPTGATFLVDQYVGLTPAEAEELAGVEGRELRTARIDGEFFALTEDYIESRVNIEIDNGIVTSAWGG